MAKWPTQEPPGATMISPVGGGGVDIPAGLEVAPRAPRRIKAPIEASSPFTASQFYITQTRRAASDMQPSRHYSLVNKEIRSPASPHRPRRPPRPPRPLWPPSFRMAGPGRLLHNNEDDVVDDNAQQQELAAAVVRNK